MLSILGEIVLGEWELGAVSTGGLSGSATGTASPTASVITVGGTPASRWSSVLGTIQLGAFELGAIPVLPVRGGLPSVGQAVGTAAPQATVIPSITTGTATGTAFPTATVVSGLLTGTAHPLGTATGLNNVYTTGAATGTADALAAVIPSPQAASALGMAYPQGEVFPVVGQPERCVAAFGSDSGGTGGNVAF